MTGLPTVQVLLDDGSGTYPTDVTASVRLADGLTWARGRSDEQSDTQPGTLALTFDNAPADAWDVVGWDTGPWGGGVSLSCDQGIRVKVNGHNRWTGRLASLPVAWPAGGQEFSTIVANATDASAALSRVALGVAADQESMLDPDLVCYYPMQEEASANKTRDISGNNLPSLRTVNPGDGSSAFGATLRMLNVDVGLADGSTGWQQVGGVTEAPYLKASMADAPRGWSALRITFAYQSLLLTVSSTVDMVALGNGLIYLDLSGATPVIGASGFHATTLTGSTGAAADIFFAEAAHVITYQMDNTGQEIWLDGVKIASDSSGAGGSGVVSVDFSLNVGALLFAASGSSDPFANQQTFSRVSVGRSLISDARVEQLHAAILNDFLGETPVARLTRILTYVDDVSAGSLDSAGDTLLGLALQTGQSVTDAANGAMGADLGIAFIDADGNLSSVSGATTAGQTTPISLDANWFAEDTSVIVDMQGVVNSAIGTSSYTGNTVTATDAASIASHGVYPGTYAWNVSTDAQALDRTDWMVGAYSEPEPRVGSLTVDLLSMDSTNLALAEALDLGSWLRITGLPSQTPGGTTMDLIVESISSTVSLTGYSLTMNVAARSRVGAWILGDTTFGVLDTTTVLYV